MKNTMFFLLKNRFLIINAKDLTPLTYLSSLMRKYKFRVIRDRGEIVGIIWEKGLYVLSEIISLKLFILVSDLGVLQLQPCLWLDWESIIGGLSL